MHVAELTCLTCFHMSAHREKSALSAINASVEREGKI
jgi:hypothetical protein